VSSGPDRRYVKDGDIIIIALRTLRKLLIDMNSRDQILGSIHQAFQSRPDFGFVELRKEVFDLVDMLWVFGQTRRLPRSTNVGFEKVGVSFLTVI
jgi:hypothetical protein